MKNRTIITLIFFSFFIMLIAAILPDLEEAIKDMNQDDFDWDKAATKKKEQFETL